MPVYRNSKELGSNVLAKGDAVIFDVRSEIKLFGFQIREGVTHVYTVTVDDDKSVFLKHRDGGSYNRKIWDDIGVGSHRLQIASAIVGKPSITDRNWPCGRDWNLVDQTKVVYALFEHIEGIKDISDGLAEKRVKMQDELKRKIAEPRTVDRVAVVKAFAKGDWGCQKNSVTELVAALIGFTSEELVEASQHIEVYT